MAEMSREELVRLVTEQVMTALQGYDGSGCTGDGSRRILVIGKGEAVSEKICPDACFLEIEDYETHQDILRYDGVLIRKLTLNQLVDLAQGRYSDSSGCAVIQALLQNVSIEMLESALPHRKYLNKIRNPFYQKLEGDVVKLQEYGIRLIRQAGTSLGVAQRHEARHPYSEKHDRLINEKAALQIVENAVGGEIHLSGSAILTPSAKDVFTKANVRVIKDL